MLINRAATEDMQFGEIKKVSRMMQVNGVLWMVAYVESDRYTGWLGYPEENYSQEYGLLAISCEDENQVITEIRSW